MSPCQAIPHPALLRCQTDRVIPMTKSLPRPPCQTGPLAGSAYCSASPSAPCPSMVGATHTTSPQVPEPVSSGSRLGGPPLTLNAPPSSGLYAFAFASPSPRRALRILPAPAAGLLLVTPRSLVPIALACSLVFLPHHSGTAAVFSPCTLHLIGTQ